MRKQMDLIIEDFSKGKYIHFTVDNNMLFFHYLQLIKLLLPGHPGCETLTQCGEATLCFNLNSSQGSALYPSTLSDASLNNCSCHSVPLGLLLESEIGSFMEPSNVACLKLGMVVKLRMVASGINHRFWACSLGLVLLVSFIGLRANVSIK